MFKTVFTFIAAALAVTFFTTHAQAQSGYQIRSGDTLTIEVLEDSSLNRTALVLPDGSISFPLAGGLKVAGQTTGQVAAALSNGLSSNFASSPNVHVAVSEVVVRTVAAPVGTSIYLTGEIANPGHISARRGTTILQAIAEAGGLTRFAAGKRIQLRRGDRIYVYNYDTNGGAGSISGNTALARGDVIVVPTRKLFE
ncbi:polysaccharide biosynthesis/export family protein [Aliiroseovarius subalbicans]|uniref:polysaccharide biosynthesis/export family protein n=1 Tax=Aliiroseovarius subalbicans TaxID=2925840 RepID=UPI001F560ACF|nr:polysaccharide biosynthesis/export family protein [Aliiroseovarius subalbicans]MCI2401155.1 polysaccharide export protein [Aliiroseovarius subalbicans]